ncbi:MAG: S-adenosylmethionine decarboxylase [bacterium]
MYGPHLIAEGYNASKRLLGDVGFFYRTLDEYPDVIGMRKVMPPHVQQYLEPGDPDWGLSGFVIIAESHIAIHTYPTQGFVTLDIFSCKPFDTEAAVSYFIDCFKVKAISHKVFKRGRDFPKDIRKSIKIVSMDREKVAADHPH